MATYPNFRQLRRSSTKPLDDTRWDRATNGDMRGRAMWPGPKLEFKIEHALDLADTIAIKNFYLTNRTSIVEFKWAEDGQTYNVVMKSPPNIESLSDILRKVTVELEEA